MKTVFKMIQIINMVLLLSMVFLSCKDSKTIHQQHIPKNIYSADSTTVRFEGIVTDVINDCWSDGVCSIEVNQKWWIEIIYGLRDPNAIPKERGKSSGISFKRDNESIGKKVKVYAGIIKNNRLTLEGDKAYYVEVINNK